MNYGPSGVDFFIPYILEEGFQYVANINSDMLMGKGWDKVAIEILEDRGPCSVSLTLVEPRSTCKEPVRMIDDLDFFGEEPDREFQQNAASGKYDTVELIAFNHPIITTIDDFTKVGGYSDGMDMEWIRSVGSSLDPYFALRLHRLHKGNFRFIRTGRAFAYHHSSYNRSKFGFMSGKRAKRVREIARGHFRKKTGTTVGAFVKRVGANG